MSINVFIMARLNLLIISNGKKNYYICDKHFLSGHIKIGGFSHLLATDEVSTLYLRTPEKNSPSKQDAGQMDLCGTDEMTDEMDGNISLTTKRFRASLDYISIDNENVIKFPENGNNENAIQLPKNGNNEKVIQLPKNGNNENVIQFLKNINNGNAIPFLKNGSNGKEGME
ncbi:uncharacterized protein ACN2A1_000634 isoform 1-T1 [Glossina fuscipes fuscipes]